MPTTLTDFFTEQREKFQKQRDDARAKLEEAEAELRALDAYEAAKKPLKASSSAGQKSQRKPRETGKRIELLNIIKTEYPDGVTRSGLLVKFNVKGDKQGEQSLSNTLSALKRAGQITLENGTYRAA